MFYDEAYDSVRRESQRAEEQREREANQDKI